MRETVELPHSSQSARHFLNPLWDRRDDDNDAALRGVRRRFIS